MTRLADAPHGLPEGSGVVVVQSLGTQEFFEGLGGLQGMVVRHFVEEMVGDVGRSNAVVEPVKDTVGSVDCGQGTSNPRPFTLSILGNRRIGVLQPSVQNQPGVGYHVGVPVPESDGKNSVLGWKHEVAQIGNLGNGGESRDKDFGANLSGKHGRVGAEVIGNASIQRLSLVVQLSCRGQSHQIQRPANVQVGPNLESRECTVSHGFMEDGIKRLALVVGTEAVFGGRRRNMRLSVCQMVRATVVLGVGVLPGKVRNQQKLVGKESKKVVPSLAGRESSVSALVGDNPGSSHDGSHPKGIGRPSSGPGQAGNGIGIRRKIRREVLGSSVHTRSTEGKTTDQIVHGPEITSVEAVIGDGGLHLTLRGKLGSILGEGIVRGDPVSVGIKLLRHGSRLAFGSFSSLSHGVY
mmetsp:Transcript_17827/g.44482  ORF Transcript_17827/g.44482 Transcript_17827/m.44482 type:complete len:408 (+) Transcript_17827:306-1529(+)